MPTTWTVDGWTGGATDSSGVVWRVGKDDGWQDGVDVRLVISDKPQDDGADDGPGFLGARYITLTGTVEAPDPAAFLWAREQFTALLADGAQRKTLTVAETHLTRYCDVRRAGRPRWEPETDVIGKWQLELVAADPRRYSALQVLTTNLPTSGGSGFTFPTGFPLTVPTPVGSTGVVTAVNAGRFRSYPSVTVTGPVTNPVLENATTGLRLRMVYDVLAGDTLVADFANKVVLVNGVAPVDVLDTGSTWWALQPGSNEVRYTATTGASGSLMTFTYRSAWT